MVQISQDVIAAVDHIPTHQAVAREVLRMCASHEMDVPQFLRVLSSDQILSAHILKIANSSLYNFPRMIPSVDRAVVVLGFNTVKEIAMALSVQSLFKGFQSSHGLQVNQLWKHSLRVALILKEIAEKYDSGNKELLYFGGLLHDVGKVIILSSFDNEYSILVEKSVQERIPLLDLEKKFLGLDHSDIGGRVLDQWNLPTTLVLLTRYHHRPEEYKSGEKEDFLIRLVYMGNLIGHLLERSLSRYADLIKIEPTFKDYLSIPEKEFEKLLNAVQKEITEQHSFINLFEMNEI